MGAVETTVEAPTSREAAVDAFGDGAGVTVIGGGTIVMPLVIAGRVRPTRALLLARADLDGVERDGGSMRIGAAATVQTLLDAPEPLASAARNVGDYEVRSQGTIGGNLCARATAAFPAGDLQAALLALDARVRSAGEGGEQVEDVEEFLARPVCSRLVLEIEIDANGRRGAYATLRRPHAHHYTPLAVAASAAADGSGLRVAAHGVGVVARRLRGVEETGEAARALDGVELRDDALASAWYRERMLPVLVGRALSSLEESR